jgi:hypothetical protein
MDTVGKKYPEGTDANPSLWKKIALAAIALILPVLVSAQSKDTTFVDYERLDPVELSSGLDEEKRKQYQILKRRVIKTMPYAKMAAFKIRAMEDELATIKGSRARKKYIKKCEKGLKAMYTEQLKKLTIGEGQVLMLLIHRETGKTTWEIMKDYSGRTEAFFWQTFGSFWGHDLKSEFDPVINYQIDHIIQLEKLE